jgi:hypothetical protein
MHTHDTPGYDDIHEAERLVALADDLMRRASEILGHDVGFEAFLADHPELAELRHVGPENDEIRAEVEAKFARRSYRLRVRLADWIDGLLLN